MHCYRLSRIIAIANVLRSVTSLEYVLVCSLNVAGKDLPADAVAKSEAWIPSCTAEIQSALNPEA